MPKDLDKMVNELKVLADMEPNKHPCPDGQHKFGDLLMGPDSEGHMWQFCTICGNQYRWIKPKPWWVLLLQMFGFDLREWQ